jgi:cytochrome c2
MTFHNTMTSYTPFSKRKSLSKVSFLTFILAVIFSISANAEVDKIQWQEGRNLFKANCAACHNPKNDGTGPALMGVTSRWEAAGDYKGKTGNQWLHIWIKNWNDAASSGYEYAKNMAASRPSAMNSFLTLKDEDIDKILLYVENPDAGGVVATAVDPNMAKTAENAEAENAPNYTLYLFVSLLVVLVAILVGVTNKLDQIIEETETGKPSTKVSIPFYKRKSVITIVILLGVLALGYKTVDSAVSLGRQQGYQPTQPIKYSHALHAGKHKIDCQYCHSTAAKGKHSNIPSLNTCMNCHKAVSKGPKYGTEEIAKIYDAVGWDAKTQTYSKPAKPVEWVRIHNLPDHVYFNHAQHVTAGKVECQTCHGPIETMEEVYQYSPLSMGWCINCHRQTEVQFGNNYYGATYEKLHEDLKNKKLDKVTVSDIGGTECQRCHY